MRDQRMRVVALAAIAIFSAAIEAVTLAIVAQVATSLINAKNTHVRLTLLHIHAPTGELVVIALILAVVRLALQAPLSIIPARIASDALARMRTSLFDAFTRASWEVQSRDREGQLQEVMTSQTMQATTQGLINLLGLIVSTCTLTVLLAFAFALNPLAATLVLIVAFCMFAPLRPVRGLGKRRGRALSRAQVGYAAGIAESIRVAEETQVFGADAAWRARIAGLIEALRKRYFETQLLIRLSTNLSQSFVYIFIIVGLAALYAINERGHFASLTAVVLILIRASASGQNLQNNYQSVVQAMPFFERVQEAERRYREGARVVGGVALARVGSLVFEGVGYEYRRGRPVLSDICFEVAGGETVGVIGPSGAGKSTLVQLLLRLRDPCEGRFLVNGVPAREVASGDWHRLVAYVPQEPRLLHASVADNIRYFRDISMEDVQRAGRLARIHEDVMGWADGYETIVGPRADAVSGGQQQRICLARALAARPEVLVLDEPTSALDPKSESLIQQSLSALEHELTLFIVAHRMSTLDICDRVMIIIDGKLVAFEHDQLSTRAQPLLPHRHTNDGGGIRPIARIPARLSSWIA